MLRNKSSIYVIFCIVFIIVFTALGLIRHKSGLHLRQPPVRTLTFDNGGMLSPEEASQIEQRSQQLYQREHVRVVLITAGVQAETEAALERDKGLRWATAASPFISHAGLYPPTIVVYVNRMSDASPMISKTWSPNFWYAHWEELPSIQHYSSTAEYIDRYISSIQARAFQQTVSHSWHRRAAPQAFVIAVIFIYLLLTIYWLEGLVIRAWDGRPKKAWTLSVECSIVAVVLPGSLYAVAYLMGWPELDVWVSHLITLCIAIPFFLLLLTATGRLKPPAILTITTLLFAVWLATLRFAQTPSHSIVTYWELELFRNTLVLLTVLCAGMLAGRLWLTYMGEQSEGFVGDIASRVQDYDRGFIRIGKFAVYAPPHGFSAAVRSNVAQSSLANVYWLFLQAISFVITGIYLAGYSVFGDRFSHRGTDMLRVQASQLPWRLARHCLVAYFYLPRAKQLLLQGKLTEARTNAVHAVDLLKTLTPHWPNAARSSAALNCYGILGEIVRFQGDPQTAQEFLLQAWADVEQETIKGDISPRGIDTRMQMGRYYQETGNPDKAQTYFQEALQCLDMLKSEFFEGTDLLSLRDISRTLRSARLSIIAEGLGGPITAAFELRAFLSQWPARASEAAYSVALCLERSHDALGNSRNTERQTEADRMRTRAFATTTDAQSPITLVLNLLMTAAEKRTSLRSLYEDPLQDLLWEKAPSDTEENWELRDQKRPQDSDKTLNLEFSVAAWLARNEGVRLMSHDLDKSKAVLLLALEQYRLLGKADGLTDCYIRLAEVGIMNGQLISALHVCNIAIRLAQNIGHIDLQRQAHLALSRLYRQTGNMQAAQLQCDQAIALIEEVRSKVINPDARALFTGSRIDAYAEQILILLASGQPALALEYVERSKSRALVELLGNHKINVRDSADQNLVHRDEELQRKLSLLDYRLRTLGYDADDSSSSDISRAASQVSRQGLINEQADLRSQLTDVKRQIRESVQEWTSLRVVRQPPFDDKTQPDDLRRQLLRCFDASEERVVALEYYVMDEKTVLFLVPAWAGEEALSVAELDLSHNALKQLVHNDFQKSILDGKAEPHFLETLYTTLLEPVIPELERLGATMLLFAPHAELHALPLHALCRRNTEGQLKFLIEDYPCAYVPSLSVLGYLEERAPTNQRRALVMGNPLPTVDSGNTAYEEALTLSGAEAEAKTVAALLETEAILGKHATEVRLRSEAELHQVIHLACHAEFDSHDALQSHLVLADGLLQVDEVLDMRLHATLVTLSACSSGVSAVSAGDELVGMTRAWLYAGTSSVLASQWDVQDYASKAIIESFYRCWTQGGQSKARALQNAQKEVLERRRAAARRRPQESNRAKWPQSEDPSQWAPFILIGHPL